MDDIVISCQNILKQYSGVTVLDDVNLHVQKGSVHALLGPNGAGKTTLMRILTGLAQKDNGELSVIGKVGYLPESPPLYQEMKVEPFFRFVAQIHDIPLKKINETIGPLIKKLKLESVQNRFISHLSKGMKQRTALGALLLVSPPLLILDEPTSGMDAEAIWEMRELLQSLKGQHTILLSTHQLHDADLLCDAITILHKGKVLESGTIEELRSRYGQNRLEEIFLQLVRGEAHV